MSTEKCKISRLDVDGPQDIAVPTPDGLDSQPVQLEVVALAAGGRGVARSGDLVWFLPGGIPGDRVFAQVTRRHERYCEGRILELTVPSPARRKPPCPLQPTCGGCPWMVLDEGEQRRWKRSLIVDALRRIGDSEVEVEPVRASPKSLAYRNKLELSLGPDSAGRPAVGLHSADPGQSGIVDVGHCHVQSEPANRVLATARELLASSADEWFPAATASADPYRLVIRAAESSGQVLVALRETDRPLPGAGNWARSLSERHPEIVGVVRIRARPGRRGGARVEPLVGRTWIDESVGGVAFRLPAASFLQINPGAAAELLDDVRTLAGSVRGRHVLDLYGGVGVLGIALAREGAFVTVCEADADAVRCGRRAARKARVETIDFVHSGVGKLLREGLERDATVDLVVVNPPRSGMGARDPERIARLQPKSLIVVSCDPATLARDTRRLGKAGFTPHRVVPFDLFPQTAHVETVMLLRRTAIDR